MKRTCSAVDGAVGKELLMRTKGGFCTVQSDVLAVLTAEDNLPNHLCNERQTSAGLDPAISYHLVVCHILVQQSRNLSYGQRALRDRWENVSETGVYTCPRCLASGAVGTSAGNECDLEAYPDHDPPSFPAFALSSIPCALLFAASFPPLPVPWHHPVSSLEHSLRKPEADYSTTEQTQALQQGLPPQPP